MLSGLHRLMGYGERDLLCGYQEFCCLACMLFCYVSPELRALERVRKYLQREHPMPFLHMRCPGGLIQMRSHHSTYLAVDTRLMRQQRQSVLAIESIELTLSRGCLLRTIACIVLPLIAYLASSLP